MKQPAAFTTEPPPIPPGEDELSFQRFNMLKAESRKKANTAVVSTLMDTTFAQRRAEILKSTAPVEALLQEYPFLGTQKEVGYILQKLLCLKSMANLVLKKLGL